MPAKKPAKPTRLQVKADKKDKVTTMSKPKPAPSAGRRVNPKAAKPKPAPKPAAKPQMVNSNSATMRQIQAKADAARARAQGKPGITGPVKLPNSVRAGRNLIREGANRSRNLADSGQVRAAAQRGQQAVKAAKRNRARLAAGVGRGAKEVAALKGGLSALRSGAGAAGGTDMLLQGSQMLRGAMERAGFKPPAGSRSQAEIAQRRNPPPKPAIPRTVGPLPKRLVKQGLDAQETKARKALDARKKANSPKPANLPKPAPKPKPSSATTSTRSSAPARSSAATPAKAKPPAASATSAERRVSASTSNRESGNYGTSKTNNPLMKDMVARMKAREDKAQAAAASKLTYKPNKDSGYTPKDKVKGSKDYSSQFKDMKGGSSRFAAELKKKKKPTK
jgi:hypothetical protein